MLNFKTLIISLFLFLVPVFALSHGLGQILEKQVGNFRFDIDYSAQDNILENTPVRFTFNLFDVQSNKPAEFTHLWVRLNSEQETFLSTEIAKPSFGLSWLSFVFPEAGNYELTVRFYNGDKDLVEADFPLEVVSENKMEIIKQPPFAMGAGAGLVVAFAGMYAVSLVRKRRQKSQ